MTNGIPVLGQAGPGPDDPMYYILCQWFTETGQAGPMELDGYLPKLHGRPSAFSQAHMQHVKAIVKENLAKNGVLGAQVVIQYIYRYEVRPSPLIDLSAN